MGALSLLLRHYTSGSPFPYNPKTATLVPAAVNTAPAKVQLARKAQHIKIANLDATNSLLVSFDGGFTFFTIKAGAPPQDFDCQLHAFWVQSSAGTVAWCAVTNEG